MDILNKSIIEAIRSRYAPPTPESTKADSKQRQGVMSRTSKMMEEAMDSTASQVLASVADLSNKTREARTPAEDQETPQLDYYDGIDIDAKEDIKILQEGRADDLAEVSEAVSIPSTDGVQSSSGKVTGQGIMSPASDDSLPMYIQEGSAFRTALADQEAESYSTIFGNAEKAGGKFAGKDVTNMKMSEVFDFVKPGGAFNKYNRDTYGKNTTAIGKYQMVGGTLRDLRDRGVLKKLGITEDTPFNRATQDKIAMHLAERRVKGKSLTAARKGMRNEWEGFKKLSNAELDAIINEIGR